MNSKSERLLIITSEQATLFARASGDGNPLHREGTEATFGPFGRPTVFGALLTLVALRDIDAETLKQVEAVRSIFSLPVYPGEKYLLKTEVHRSAASVRILLPSRTQTLMATTISLKGSGERTVTSSTSELKESDSEQYRNVTPYNPNLTILRKLCRTLGIPNQEATEFLLSVLAFCSFLLGMQITSYGAIFGLSVDLLVPEVKTGPSLFGFGVREVLQSGAIIDVINYCRGRAVASACIRTRAIRAKTSESEVSTG